MCDIFFWFYNIRVIFIKVIGWVGGVGVTHLILVSIKVIWNKKLLLWTSDMNLHSFFKFKILKQTFLSHVLHDRPWHSFCFLQISKYFVWNIQKLEWNTEPVRWIAFLVLNLKFCLEKNQNICRNDHPNRLLSWLPFYQFLSLHSHIKSKVKYKRKSSSCWMSFQTFEPV